MLHDDQNFCAPHLLCHIQRRLTGEIVSSNMCTNLAQYSEAVGMIVSCREMCRCISSNGHGVRHGAVVFDECSEDVCVAVIGSKWVAYQPLRVVTFTVAPHLMSAKRHVSSLALMAVTIATSEYAFLVLSKDRSRPGCCLKVGCFTHTSITSISGRWYQHYLCALCPAFV